MNISLGNSAAWQVAPNAQGNLIFLKPMESPALTNMSVVTDRRTYHFELNAQETLSAHAKDMTFHVQFKYPNDYMGIFERDGLIPTGKNSYGPAAYNCD